MAEDFEKIRRNVEKMLSMSAPEADVDEYLKSERLTPDEFKIVATGKAKLGDIRVTQKSEGEIAKTLSRGQTIPMEGIHRSTILPASTIEATGEHYFDPDAGLLGIAKRGAMTPGDVMMGNLDPASPEGARRMAETAMTFSPISAATRAAEAVIPGTLKSLRVGTPKTPTAQELKAAGKAGMKEARDMAVDYSADAVRKMADEVQGSLETDGFSVMFAPKTFSILSGLREPPIEAGSATVASLNNLVTVRRALQKAAGDFNNPDEQAAATRALNVLDEFVMAADPQSVVAGPAAAAAGVMGEARGNFAAQFRSKRVTDAIEKAEQDAAAAASGQNLDNRTRQVLKSILQSDKELRGFSKEETALLDEIVRGKRGTNLARWIGNWAGGGGGLGSVAASSFGAGMGALMGGTPGAIVGAGVPAATGITARNLAASLTRSQARRLDELIRQRSPLYKKAQENLPIETMFRPAIRASVGRGLMFMRPQEE